MTRRSRSSRRERVGVRRAGLDGAIERCHLGSAPMLEGRPRHPAVGQRVAVDRKTLTCRPLKLGEGLRRRVLRARDRDTLWIIARALTAPEQRDERRGRRLGPRRESQRPLEHGRSPVHALRSGRGPGGRRSGGDRDAGRVVVGNPRKEKSEVEALCEGIANVEGVEEMSNRRGQPGDRARIPGKRTDVL